MAHLWTTVNVHWEILKLSKWFLRLLRYNIHLCSNSDNMLSGDVLMTQSWNEVHTNYDGTKKITSNSPLSQLNLGDDSCTFAILCKVSDLTYQAEKSNGGTEVQIRTGCGIAYTCFVPWFLFHYHSFTIPWERNKFTEYPGSPHHRLSVDTRWPLLSSRRRFPEDLFGGVLSKAHK